MRPPKRLISPSARLCFTSPCRRRYRKCCRRLATWLVQNLKDTALVSLITLSDLTFRAESLRNITQDSTTIYGITLFIYFGLALAF